MRFSSRDDWHYVKSSDMVADIGTRPGATVKDVDPDSNWLNGYPWMKQPVSEFPMKTCNEVKLDNTQLKEYNDELVLKKDIEVAPSKPRKTYTACARKVPEEVGERYKFAK